MLSVSAHLIFILIVAAGLHLVNPFAPQEFPRSIAFAFIPTEDELNTNTFVPESEPAPNSATAESRAPSQRSNSAATSLTTKPTTLRAPAIQETYIPEATPLATRQNGPARAVSSPNPAYLPVAELPSELSSTFIYNNVRVNALQRDRLFGENAEFRQARLTIPPAQLDFLEKKVHRFVENFTPDFSDTETLQWEDDEQVYDVAVENVPGESPEAFDRLLVRVTTEVNGKKLATDIEMQRLAFSHFAQFVDYWDPHVAIHDDEFDGRFHTNTEFNFSNARGVHPTFRGKVTTAGYSVHNRVNLPFFPRDSIFVAGIETGVRPIKFPKRFNLHEAGGFLDSTTLYFPEEAWIHFYSNGKFRFWTKSNPGKTPGQLPEQPFIFLGGKNGTLHVEGIVRGKVLIYSQKKIIIDGSITYARPPEYMQEAEDYLGLVSEKSIEIAHPRVTGPGDLYIHAAILAKGTFRVRNLYGHGHATLHIFGSLTAGSLTATEPRYATRIKFDRRLETRRPANFPMTDRYELIKWDKKWRLLQ